jgi:trehalose 6-phosphate phosphatase
LPRTQTTDSLPHSTVLWDFFDRLQSAPSSALLLDYDGTLAPFRIERDRAYPYPEVLPSLEKIVRNGRSRVVVISGRPAAEVKTLLGTVNNLEMWGAHGLERLSPDGGYRQIPINRSALELLSQAKEWIIESKLTSLAEIKPGGIAIHWRGLTLAEANRVEAKVRQGWSVLAQNPEIKLLSFESGIELRVARPDKGDAVSTIIEESSPETEIAYLGDDFTDEDSFRTLNGRGLTLLVRSEYRETSAQVWLKPPQQLTGFLEQWLSEIS